MISYDFDHRDNPMLNLISFAKDAKDSTNI